MYRNITASTVIYPLSLHDALPILMDKVDAFAPDLILISAGFDAHRRDPVSGGSQSLEEVDFAWATRAIADVANRRDRKSTRLNSSHVSISYAVFCLKKNNYL